MTNAPLPVPLILFRALADLAGTPAALLVDAGPGDAAALLPLVDSEPFGGLRGYLPTLYRTGIDPALADALQGAGWRPIAARALRREDEQLVRQVVPTGAELVEGDWYMGPPPRLTGAQAASRALSLQLAQLIAADAPTQEIEALLRKDPTLSYHLLRLVNSLGMGVGRRVTSFSQAILLLGREQLRRWVNLMLFASRQGDMRSQMLLARVAVRARLIEQLTRARGGDKHAQDQGFIAGMFSLLGVLFGMELEEVLAPLSVSDAVHDALLGNKGELGVMLRLCEAVEDGDVARAALHLALLQLDNVQFNLANIEANHWMLSALRSSRSPAG